MEAMRVLIGILQLPWCTPELVNAPIAPDSSDRALTMTPLHLVSNGLDDEAVRPGLVRLLVAYRADTESKTQDAAPVCPPGAGRAG